MSNDTDLPAPSLSPAALKKAKELAYRQIAERCKTDLFFLNKYVLGCDIEDEFVHGILCAATRPLLYWRNKEYAKQFVYPSDYGIAEDPTRPLSEQIPTQEQIDDFYRRSAKFIPDVPSDVTDKTIFTRPLDPSKKNLLQLIPRGCLKTTAITVGYALQFFLVYSEEALLLDSETSTNSVNFLMEIKGHMTGNETYREIYRAVWGVYPDHHSNDKNWRWTNSYIDVGARKNKDKTPSIDTGGVDTTKNSRHYHTIINDDLHSEQNTGTKEQIEKVKTHYRLQDPLLNPGCPTLIIGTRWTDDDLYSMLMEDHADDFNFIIRSAKAPDGDLFYPSRLSKEELIAKRKKLGGYLFSCQYMNDPIDHENARFKKDYFQYRSMEEIMDLPINWYLTIDSSISDPRKVSGTSDFVGMVLSGMDYQENIYVKYVVKKKMSEIEMARLTVTMYRKFLPKLIVVETIAGAGKAIITAFNTVMKELGIYLPIRYIESRHTAKEARIEALVPKYEAGQVYHIRECPNIRELEDELIAFPKAKNDDVSDAFATVLEVASPPIKNQRRHQSDEKRKARLKKLNAPRSAAMGY